MRLKLLINLRDLIQSTVRDGLAMRGPLGLLGTEIDETIGKRLVTFGRN